VIPANGLIRGIHAGGVSRSGDRTALKCAEVRLEPRRAGVREVVSVGGLGAQGFLRTGHRNIQQLIHDGLSVALGMRAQPRMLMMVCVIWLSVWIICALAWKLRCAWIMC